MATKTKSARSKTPREICDRQNRPPKASRGTFTISATAKPTATGSMKPLLGGKGANLAEMTRIGLPVPPGFTITTEVCTYFYAHKKTYPPTLQAQMEKGIANMERIMGTKFGDTTKMPLLVAVRSGARDSMPGMMDTILNLGLNDETVQALVKATNNERFAWDCYRRFIQMYGDVVMGVQKREGEDHEPFESVIEHYKDEKYGQHDIDDSKLDAADYQELVTRFKKLVKERTGKAFPNDPWDQLRGAAGAVFGSWMNDRAIVYRRKYNIPQEWGTAVNVQAMVYGNTGLEFRIRRGLHAQSGERRERVFYGEFLINAQGEDVVAGVRTPQPVLELKKIMPKAYADLLKVRARLEKHFKDVQDVEFTIQDGSFHAADAQRQTHRGGRAEILHGHVQGETDRLENGRHAQSGGSARSVARADFRSKRKSRKRKRSPTAFPPARARPPAKFILNADRAAAAAEKGEKVLLVRNETSPGRFARHDRGRRHPHRERRRLLARRTGRAADGQSLHLRRIGFADRLRKENRHAPAARSSKKATSSRSTAPAERFTPAKSPPRRARSSPALLEGDKAAQKTEKFNLSTS